MHFFSEEDVLTGRSQFYQYDEKVIYQIIYRKAKVLDKILVSSKIFIQRTDSIMSSEKMKIVISNFSNWQHNY